MAPADYGLIAYVTGPLADFIIRLRQQLHPEDAASRPHLSLLPPRAVRGTEAEALELIEEKCQAVQPFEISLGDVESFVPRTPTVFLRVAHGAYRMRELHDRLNTGPLEYDENFPYMPHLTIFRMDDPARAAAGLQIAQQRWAEYRDTRRILIEQLTFVRGSREAGWADIAPVPLGRRLAPAAL
jgi:2'-5' RNA ligase